MAITSMPPSTPLGLFERLPAELRERVVSFLDPTSLANFVGTSRAISVNIIEIMNKHQSVGLKNYITNLCLELNQDEYAEIRHGLECTKTVISSETVNLRNLQERSTNIQRIIFNVLLRLNVTLKREVLEDVSIPSFCNYILRLKQIVQREEQSLLFRNLHHEPTNFSLSGKHFDDCVRIVSDFVLQGTPSAAFKTVQDLDTPAHEGGYSIRDLVIKTSIENFTEHNVDSCPLLKIANLISAGPLRDAMVAKICTIKNMAVTQTLQLAWTIADENIRSRVLGDVCYKLLKSGESNVCSVINIVQYIPDLHNARIVLEATFQCLIKTEGVTLSQILETAYMIQSSLYRGIMHTFICTHLLQQEDVDLNLVLDIANLIQDRWACAHIVKILIPRFIKEGKRTIPQICQIADNMEEADPRNFLFAIICKELFNKEPVDIQQIAHIASIMQTDHELSSVMGNITAYLRQLLKTGKNLDHDLLLTIVRPISEAVIRVHLSDNTLGILVEHLVRGGLFNLAMQTAHSIPHAPFQDAAYESIIANLSSQGDFRKALEVARHIQDPEKRTRLLDQLEGD